MIEGSDASPYYATDNQATANGFGYLKKTAITVTGWIKRDPTHNGGLINRNVEKSGKYPHRIFYDAVDPLGNQAVTAIREVYVENPCASAEYPTGRICTELSEQGKEPVCSTCTPDGCVCVAKQEEVVKVVIAEYVPPKDYIAPVILISTGSVAAGFAKEGIRAKNSEGNEFTYDELELGKVYTDPGAVASDINANAEKVDLTSSIVRTVFPSVVDATTVKTKTDAAGVVETIGGLGTVYQVSYEVTDAAGCTVTAAGLTECDGLTTNALRIVKIVQSKTCQDCIISAGVESCVPRMYDKNGVATFEALCPDSTEIDSAGYTVETFSVNSACSANGLCIGLAATETEAVKEKVTPVLTMFGLDSVTILDGEPWELCAPGAALSVVCDRGLDEASDVVADTSVGAVAGSTVELFRSRAGRLDQGRVLNKFTRVCGTTATIEDIVTGAVSLTLSQLCGYDTSVVGEYTVTFSFTNDDEMTGSVSRKITVLKNCNYPQPKNPELMESVCIIYKDKCSVDGLCVDDIKAGVAEAPEEPPPDVPPVIELRVPDIGDGSPDLGTVLNRTVRVRQGQPYAACGKDPATGEDIQPEATVKGDKLCEPGVVAYDVVTTREGDIETAKRIELTDNVMACPPAECESLGVMDETCAPHKFSVKGIQGCVETTFPVNTILPIQFMVQDQTSKTTVEYRYVMILDPCPKSDEVGEWYTSRASFDPWI